MSIYDHLCRNCRWRPICNYAKTNGPCDAWEHRTKVKPRRLCDFCERRRPIDDDYGRYTMEFTKLTTLESINLTTGERTEPKRKVEYALFLYDDADDGEVGSFPIRYCPLCGRKLESEQRESK